MLPLPITDLHVASTATKSFMASVLIHLVALGTLSETGWYRNTDTAQSIPAHSSSSHHANLVESPKALISVTDRKHHRPHPIPCRYNARITLNLPDA